MKIKKEDIVKKLQERGAIRSCARCGSNNFTILDEYSKIVLDKEIDGNIRIGGPVVPVAIVGCTRCGAITMHALGALGLLNNEGEKDGSSK